MGRILLMLVALLALLGLLLANEMKWIDLKKTFAAEEPYTPPKDIGVMWRWHNNDKGFREWAQVVFFEGQSNGDISVIASGQCRWPCW